MQKMKKLVGCCLALLLLGSLLWGCEIDGIKDDSANEESSLDELSKAVSREESKSNSQESVDKKMDIVFNVKDYGAKANGTDDSAAIQAAIDKCAAAGGGTVYFPAGTYSIKTTLVKKAKVSLKGSGMFSAYLNWTGSSDSAMIDISNHALWGTSIEDLFFQKGGDIQKVTGILGGSTLQNYNSAIASFKNLVFSNLYCGISGNAEPAGVGIFDCYFENIFASGCEYGLHLYGSGNTIVHPRIATCGAGLVLDFLNGESFDGIHVIGGIFASNKTDILIPAKNGTRPCNFVGTWFEDASEGILTIKNTDTRIMNLSFRDCMLNSKADGKNYFLFDASKALGVVTLDSCTVVKNQGIIEPRNPSSKLVIRNLQVYEDTGSSIINDTDHGKFTSKGDGSKKAFDIKHKLGQNPSFANAIAASENLPEFYITADEKSITINFQEAPKSGMEIALFWEVKK